MKIGIDARLINETGVGRYIRNLIREIGKLDSENQYIIYLPESSFDSFVLPSGKWEKRLATPRWHTLWEQVAMPVLFLKDRLNLIHVPYFNVPVLYPGKFIVTIHDLTILHFQTGKATTLPYWLYRLRMAGYLIILTLSLRKAAGIIVPSQTTKQEIVDHFHIPGTKIFVTYEGVDEKISAVSRAVSVKNLPYPYFLYVGNAYPHKNLELLVSAFGDFIRKHKERDYRLVLVGKDDFFYSRLKKEVEKEGLQSSVIFYGRAGDEELHGLYTGARALVFPSLMEGFGLPALEALSLGTPVLCSDIPIFHEILKDFPHYVNPYDRNDLCRGFSNIAQEKNHQQKGTKEKLWELLRTYSWEQLGRDTVRLYNTLGSTSQPV